MKNKIQRIKEVYKQGGFFYVIYRIFKKIYNFIYFTIVIPLKSQREFIFKNKAYPYFYSLYNTTWDNERAVEIPIIMKKLREFKGKKILEVGNVLSHYFSINHDIIDKYEVEEGVINEDVVNFSSSQKYDLIVSISTLEHVGFDEDEKEPLKILKAFENLINLCTEEIIVTMPLGENPELDKLIANKKIPFTEQYFLKRISAKNDWKEVDWKDVKGTKRNYPFNEANGIVINIIKKNKGVKIKKNDEKS